MALPATRSSEEGDVAQGVATDGNGNVYVSGVTEGWAGEEGERQIIDAFVAKYSETGALIWKRELGTSAADYSLAVATDGDGNVYISGETWGSLGGTNRGDDDAWLAKYSGAGALRWKRQLGTSRVDWSNGVATDADGNVFISGGTGGSLGGADDEAGDAFVAKYSRAGTLQWTRQLGTFGHDTSHASRPMARGMSSSRD